MKTFVEYFAIVLAGLVVLSLLFVCGCAGRSLMPGTKIEHSPDGSAVTVTLATDKKLPAVVTVKSGEDKKDYVPPEAAKREAKTFPLGVFLGWLTPAGALCFVALLFGVKPMIPIIAGGGIIVATAMAVSLAFWEILLSLLALAVLAALVCGLMWLRRSRMLKKIVTNVEHKAETDPAFNAGVTAAMTDADGKSVLSNSESALVDKIRKKKRTKP